MPTIQPPTIEEARTAARVLRGITRRTPLLPLEEDDSLFLKLEIHQPIGSFKLRGVFHAASRFDESQRARGLSTVSAGNTAQALAWCGRHYGTTARSLMPETAPTTKIEAVRRLGGEPVLVPTDHLFAYLKERRWEEEPYAFVHPWTERNVMIGHATMALEIAEQCPDLESIYIPVGGGGLCGGVASTLRQLLPQVRIVAVEPEGCPSLHASLALGRATETAVDTICDGVAVPYMTAEVFELLEPLVDESLLVPDAVVKDVIRRLALRSRIVVEGSAALAVAAALAESPSVRGKSVCLVTGGSIDSDKLVQILAG